MKVAILSSIAWRTPPRQYGPSRWHPTFAKVWSKGIDTTLFATADSITNARLSWSIEQPYGDDPNADAGE